MQASRPLGCSASVETTVRSLRLLRKDSRRVWKWYASAPKGSGRRATWLPSRHGRSRSNVMGGSVDAAHAVNRDVLHEEVARDELRLGGRLGLEHRLRGLAVGGRRRRRL